MDMNHTPEQMATSYAAAVNALVPKGEPKLGTAEALVQVTAYLEASPVPPQGVTPAEKLLAGVVKALR